MTTTESFQQLAQQQIPNSATTIYTVPASTQAIIRHVTVVNPTGSDCWVKIWTTGNGDSNLVMPQVTLGPGEWAEFDGSVTLDAGETYVAQGETNAALTITLHGLEIATA